MTTETSEEQLREKARLTDQGNYDLACVCCYGHNPHATEDIGATHLVRLKSRMTNWGNNPRLPMCQACLNDDMQADLVASAISVRDNLGQLTMSLDDIAEECRYISRLIEDYEIPALMQPGVVQHG